MLRKYLGDRRGNIAILSSVMLTSLVGVSGLVAEFGNGLLNRMENQRVADAAAMAGGEAYAANQSASAVTTAVNRIVSLNGSSATVSSQIVTSPSGDGNDAVEVNVQSSVPVVLARLIWNQNSLPVAATSYAEVKTLGPGGGTGCILALDPTASKAITISGSANVHAPNCDVIANSNNSDAINMSGSAQLTTPCTVSVGGQITTSGLDLTSCTKPYTGAPSGSDPYASVPNQSLPGSSSCLTLPNPATNVPPGYYCKGINISGTASFQPGLFIVQGNLAFQGGSNVSGTGVTFFIYKSGTTAISGSATVNLSAPTSGTFSGILFFGDRSGTTANNNNISGSSASTLIGALYYPTQQVTYSGGSSTPNGICTQIIGDVITFSGSTYMGTACSGAGVQTIHPPGGSTNIALVQ